LEVDRLTQLETQAKKESYKKEYLEQLFIGRRKNIQEHAGNSQARDLEV